MRKSTIVGALLLALLLSASSTPVQAENWSREENASTARQSGSKSVAAAFEAANRSATTRAKDPKLTKLMVRHKATLKKLRELVSEIDLLAAAVARTPPQDPHKVRADAERIQHEAWELFEGLADSAIDEAKENYAEAKEEFKLSCRILSEHMERQTQVIQKVTS